MTLAAGLQKDPSADLDVITAALVDATERLTKVLIQETTFVRALRIKEIGPLQGQKTELAASYQKAFKALITANEGKILPASHKEKLESCARNLASAVVDNELALRVGKVATERLIGSIVAAVRDQQKNAMSYAPQSVAPRNSFMTAAAVDRRL